AKASKVKGASGLFHKADPRNTDVDEFVRQDAQQEIRQLFKSNSINMKDMDLDGLTSSIDQLAVALKDGKFIQQFRDLDTARQSAIVNALRQSTSYSARSKLAHVSDIKSAFAGLPTNVASQHRNKFVKELTVEQLSDIINKGRDVQRNSLYETVNQDSTKLNDVVRKIDSPAVKAIKKFLDVEKPNDKKMTNTI
ncbi:MAG: hypothetical protein V1765_02015, partial [bacterium]